MYIPIRSIIVNKQKIDEEHVDDFVEILERGRKVPPITVRRLQVEGECDIGYLGIHYSNGGWSCRECLKMVPFVLVDGRHRLAAHKILGKEMIEALVTL